MGTGCTKELLCKHRNTPVEVLCDAEPAYRGLEAFLLQQILLTPCSRLHDPMMSKIAVVNAITPGSTDITVTKHGPARPKNRIPRTGMRYWQSKQIVCNTTQHSTLGRQGHKYVSHIHGCPPIIHVHTPIHLCMHACVHAFVHT